MRNDRTDIEPELVRRIAGGDKAAFGQVVDRLMQPAYYHALSLLADHEDAVEISQQAFIRVWKNRRKIDPERPFPPWFHTMLKRLCLNMKRDRSRKKETAMSGVAEWLEPDDGNNPHEEIQQEETRLMFKRAMSRLSPEDREILSLRDLQGYSYKAIASMLDIPAGTVMSRLYMARTRLRHRMQEEGYEYTG